METIKLIAVGDIMLSQNRGTGRAINLFGPEYPFAYVKDYLKSADILFGNLEGPISTRGKPFAKQDAHITFRASPEAVNGLKSCNFNVISFANNHSNDYGDIALLDTLDILRHNCIACVGAGRNIEETHRDIIIEKNGIKVAFLAYTTFLMYRTRPATKKRCGVSLFSLNRAKKRIRDLSKIADVVILSMHWGLDFTDYPISFQREYARELIDSGANLILGHHSHHVQGIEKYKNGLIAYSLGDFVFDERRDTIIFQCRLTKYGVVDYEIIPARITENFQTKITEYDEGAITQKKVELLSQEYELPDADIYDRMLKQYIMINVQIFLKSKNIYVIKNILTYHCIKDFILLLLRKYLLNIFSSQNIGV